MKTKIRKAINADEILEKGKYISSTWYNNKSGHMHLYYFCDQFYAIFDEGSHYRFEQLGNSIPYDFPVSINGELMPASSVDKKILIESL